MLCLLWMRRDVLRENIGTTSCRKVVGRRSTLDNLYDMLPFVVRQRFFLQLSPVLQAEVLPHPARPGQVALSRATPRCEALWPAAAAGT